jgi:hypothetical protein
LKQELSTNALSIHIAKFGPFQGLTQRTDTYSALTQHLFKIGGATATQLVQTTGTKGA